MNRKPPMEAPCACEPPFSQGFRVQVNGPNDCFVIDGRVVRALARMWTRLGIVASSETKRRALG